MTGSLTANHVAPDEFRDTLSRFPSGLTVVTAKSSRSGMVHGSTVSAFISLSLDPPLILVALAESSDLIEYVAEERRFAVNILAAGQEAVCFACGRKGPDKLAEVAWSERDGLPRLDGSAAWIACDLHDVLPGGDHVIVVGLVTGCDAEEIEPLVYHRRALHRLGERAA